MPKNKKPKVKNSSPTSVPTARSAARPGRTPVPAPVPTSVPAPVPTSVPAPVPTSVPTSVPAPVPAPVTEEQDEVKILGLSKTTFYIVVAVIVLGLIGLIVWLVMKKKASSSPAGATVIDGPTVETPKTTIQPSVTRAPPVTTTRAPNTTVGVGVPSPTVSTTPVPTPSLVPDPENYGVIQNVNTSCLQVTDKTNGSSVRRKTGCTGIPQEMFKMDENGRLRNMFSGKCLNVPMNPPETIQEGVQVTQWDCTTGNEQSNGAQRWQVDRYNRFHPVVYGSSEQRAFPYSRRCLSLDANRNVVVGACTAASDIISLDELDNDDTWYHRAFTYLRSPLIDMEDGGYCAENGNSLDVDIGTEIKMNTCNTASNQQFRLDSTGKLINLRDGRCLMPKSESLTNGTPIVNATCNDLSTTQFWNYSPSKNITLEIDSNKCLTVKDAKTTVGNNLVLSDCKDGEDQKWEFDMVTDE